MSTKQDHIITKKDRALAQIALATVGETSCPCPDDAELALLVDGRYLSEPRQEELWNHLASCSTCYEAWRIISEVQGGAVKKRSIAKIITLGGGLMAVAASIMLFVNIQYSPMPEAVFMDSAPAPILLEEVERDEVAVSPDSYLFDSAAPEKDEAEQVERTLQRQQKKSKAMSRRSVKASAPLRKSAPQESGVSARDMDDPFSILDKEEAIGEILLDINRVIPTVLQKLKQADVGNVIEVKTYKRDRGFSIEKQDADLVLIREFGYKNQELTIPVTKLKKVLKTIVKTEFPRSNKAWLKVTS